MSTAIGDTKTFVSSEVLKSGNTKLLTADGKVFYIVPVDGVSFQIPTNVATAITYHVEEKGGKEVNIIDGTGSAVPQAPSLPKTTVTATVAPGGEPPVAPAKKVATKKNFDTSYGGDFQKPWLPAEARRVAILNILTAVLQSPAVGQAVVGRNPEEIAATIRDTFTKSVALYEEKVQPIE